MGNRIIDRIKKDILHRGSLYPLVGFAIWIVITPLMSTIWNSPTSVLNIAWQRTPFLVRTVGLFLVQQGVDLNSEEIYFSIGRYFFLIYVSMVVGLYTFHKWVKSTLKTKNKFSSSSYKFLLISLSIVAIGDFVSYGLGVFSDILWRLGFAVEALFFLAMLLSTILYGISLIKVGNELTNSGVILVGAALLAPFFIFEEIIVGYLPNGPVLPFISAWTILGITAFRKQKSERLHF